MRLEDLFGPEYQKYNIFPGWLKWKDAPNKNSPQFINLQETGDTYLHITWKSTPGGLFGEFNVENNYYTIEIIPFEYSTGQKTYKCINAGFTVSVDGNSSTEMFPTPHPNQVIFTFINGVNSQIVNLDVDVLLFVATNNIRSRMKLYNRLADKYFSSFGQVVKNLKTKTGLATIVINNSVLEEDKQSLIDYVTKQSTMK